MSPALDLENGQDDDAEAGAGEKKTTPRRGPGRPPKTAQVGDLEKDIREQLQELAEWLQARDSEFAKTFLEDVPKMSKFLAARAGKNERLLRVLRILFAKDGPLAGLRAFGRTARTLAAHFNTKRAASEDEEAGYHVDDAGNTLDQFGNVVVPHS